MEHVDIVDNKLNILYQTSKVDAHAQGLLHKTVIGEVVNSKKEILLVKQSNDRQDAGQYVSPVGGHVTAGEHDDEAIRREAMEEIGFKVFELQPIGNFIYDRTVIGRHENHFFIVYELRSDEVPVLNHESESFRYFAFDELKNELKTNPQMFGDAYRAVVKECYPQLL